MYITPVNPIEQRKAPVSPQQPLRPSSKGPALRINVLRSLQLHAVTAAVVAIVVLGLGVAVLLRGGALYETSSVIYVSPTFPATLHVDSEQSYPYDSYVQEQVQAVTNYDVIDDAIRHLPIGVWRKPGESEQSAVERLEARLDVKRIGMTYQVGITLNGGNPNHLADIVNAVTTSFLAKAKSQEFYGRDERLATLRETRDQIQKDLDSTLQEQADITRSLGVAAVGSTPSNPYDSELDRMRADLTVAHEQKIQAEAQLSSLQTGDVAAPTSALNEAADEIIQADPGLSAMKADLAQKRATLLQQLAGETALNPQRKQSEAELAQIDQALQGMTTNLRQKAAIRLEQKLRSEVNRASTVESKLLSDMQKETGAAASAAPKLQRAQELTADIARLQTRYTEVDTRIGDLELESSSPAPVHLFSSALPPLGPVPSKKKMLLPLLLPISIIMGVLATILVDFLDPHIYNGSDLEGVLGFAPIGMLLNDGDVTQRVFDECILRLAAGIDHATRVAAARTFVFTAVSSGAGTTSIVENLGSALARLGRKTLTIDASGNTAPVAYVTIGANGEGQPLGFDGAPNPGSDLTVQAAAVKTDILPSNPAPLAGFVAKAFQDLTREYDIVLVDAAPLLISAETEYLARCADVTILVAEAGKASRRKVTRAARLLEKLDISGAAAVINKVRLLRVEENLKHDLKEFEARLNEMNLRWRPIRPAKGTPAPAAGFSRAEEEAVHAEAVSFTTDGD
jgi:Mrp family chromosome partitioning ATPase/capsular polysaccharide biosynthesis protein